MNVRRMPTALVLAAGLTVAAALLPAGSTLGGCTLRGTGGDLVEVELAFAGAASEGGPLGVGETLYDPPWEVELTEARLVLGAAYVFPPAEIADRWRLPFTRRRAHAHAGDDNLFAVNALVEWREQVVVDALAAEPTVVGPVLGEAGVADIATVWIDAPRGALAGPDGPTRGHHGWVAGVARRGDEEVRFEAGLALEDTPLSQRVDRIPLDDGARIAQGSRVRIEVLADTWLQQVDFGALVEDGALEPGDDGVARPMAPHPFQRAWLIDFHDPDAFRARVD
ncbi:MAG TPA: hypothetical protein RMH99_21485 [Sandaracinaceae bacterium LLY-WYZ-13_1]|nr:hypothetical protein [Sandaracinaceae bacterium LLY-WYZ-13_1]